MQMTSVSEMCTTYKGQEIHWSYGGHVNSDLKNTHTIHLAIDESSEYNNKIDAFCSRPKSRHIQYTLFEQTDFDIKHLSS